MMDAANHSSVVNLTAARMSEHQKGDHAMDKSREEDQAASFAEDTQARASKRGRSRSSTSSITNRAAKKTPGKKSSMKEVNTPGSFSSSKSRSKSRSSRRAPIPMATSSIPRTSILVNPRPMATASIPRTSILINPRPIPDNQRIPTCSIFSSSWHYGKASSIRTTPRAITDDWQSIPTSSIRPTPSSSSLSSRSASSSWYDRKTKTSCPILINPRPITDHEEESIPTCSIMPPSWHSRKNKKRRLEYSQNIMNQMGPIAAFGSGNQDGV